MTEFTPRMDEEEGGDTPEIEHPPTEYPGVRILAEVIEMRKFRPLTMPELPPYEPAEPYTLPPYEDDQQEQLAA